MASVLLPSALQNTVLKTWKGDPANFETAQQALLKRAKANSEAQLGTPVCLACRLAVVGKRLGYSSCCGCAYTSPARCIPCVPAGKYNPAGESAEAAGSLFVKGYQY